MRKPDQLKDHNNQPQSSEQTQPLPPRSLLYPSNKGKLTKYFYNFLIIIFIILVVGLAVWGFNRA